VRTGAAAAAGYAIASAALVALSSTAPGFAALVVLQVATGALVGRWSAVLFPIPVLPVLEGLIDPNPSEDIRGFVAVAALALFVWAPVACALVALGVGGRKLVERRR
jgi:hypothetical protein